MRKQGSPHKGELVMCKIKRVNPNSVEAKLLEYKGQQGLIHVSEVAGRWVRDIREFVRENEYIVCKVMSTDRDHIQLSIKRVRREENTSKLNEFKRESGSEKVLEVSAKEIGKDLDQAYQEVGFKLINEFGTLSKAFEMVGKDPELLLSKGIPKNWVDVFSDIISKKQAEKSYEVKATLTAYCYKPNGLEVMKKILTSVDGVDVKYISTPKYLVVGKGKNFKEVRNTVTKAAETIVKKVQKNGGEASFELTKGK